jgi:hypothetical protein
MASHYYYNTIPGTTAGTDTVAVATSTGGTDIELRVDDGTTGNNKMEILKALEAIRNFIVVNNAPA